MLAVQQEGLHAVGSHGMGTAPKAQWQSVFQSTPWATLLTLQPDKLGKPLAQDAETPLSWHTQGSLFSNTTRMRGSSFLQFFPAGLCGKKGLTAVLPSSPASRQGGRGLGEN